MRESLRLIRILLKIGEPSPPAEDKETDILKTRPLAIAQIKPGEKAEDHKLLTMYQKIDMAG